MKTTLIIVFASANILVTYAVLGQSSFRLNNYNLPAVNAPVFDDHGVPLQGSNFVAELWGGAAADSLAPALAFYSGQRVIIRFLSPAGPGYFRDSYAGRDPADHPTVLSVAPVVGSAWLQVRAWDARLGATYEEVVVAGLGGYGESPLFSAHGSEPRDLLGPAAPLTGLQSFSLREVIPEPSTWALLACGGLGLWLAARRHTTHAGHARHD